MEITVQIVEAIGDCDHYMPNRDSKEKESVTIIASPLYVEISEDGTGIRPTNGCSMFETCEDPRCHFSAAARRKPKTLSKMKRAGD